MPEPAEEFPGGGIFKSTDGGVTWSDAAIEGTGTWRHISRISVAFIPGPSSTRLLVVLVATDGPDPSNGGIYRSVDGGAWTKVVSGYDARFVGFDPVDTNHLKAVGDVRSSCTADPYFGCHKAVYSTNGGSSWATATISDGNQTPVNFVNTNQGRIEFAYSASESNTVYALFKPDSQTGARLARSTDGGASYVIKNTVTYPEVGEYTNTLWVSPLDPNLIVIGGGGLWRSTNGGTTFSLIMDSGIAQEHGHWDQQFMVSPPNSPSYQLYACNDGGVFVTDDVRLAQLQSSSHWRSLNHTFQTTQYDGVDGSAATNLILGGNRDNYTLRVRANETDASAMLGAGDGGFAAVDPSNPDYCYSGGGGPGLGLLFRIQNCSANSTNPPLLQDYTELLPPDKVSQETPFLAPFVLDPRNPNTLIYGGSSLWRTNNAKASPSPTPQTWTEIKVNPTMYPSPSGTPYRPIRISAVAIAPSTSSVIWVAENDVAAPIESGTNYGRLYKTSNGTKAEPVWTPVDDNTSAHNPLPNRYITRIVIDPDDPQIVYVAFGGFRETTTGPFNNLYKTTDGGNSWTPITGPAQNAGGLPEVPIRGFARHPTNADKLYAGTEIGIYASNDAGAHWSPVVEGPANVPIADLKFMAIDRQASPQPTPSTVLIAATHGRGIWTTDVNQLSAGNIAANDFDGDGRSDIAVVRHAAPSPSPAGSSIWYLRGSSQGYTTFSFGLAGDQVVPADFDGDGKTDIAVYRDSDHTWYWSGSKDQSVHQVIQGASGDIAVPGDYDGDNKADQALWRPSNGHWYINKSSGGTIDQQWGLQDDIPFAADFDGDGVDELSVARLKYGVWYIYLYGSGQWQLIQFGLSGDIPVVGDYDGDQKADVAVFRPSNGYWYFTYAVNGWQNYSSLPFGYSNDIPVPGDYDGDGKTDVAMWRPSDGVWYILQSTTGIMNVHFGLNGDIPVSRKTVTGMNNRPSAGKEDWNDPESKARPPR